VLKDRLYTKAGREQIAPLGANGDLEITSALVRLIAPVLVFTSEEIWRYLPKAKGDRASVHMTEFPAAETLTAKIDAQKKEAWEELARCAPRARQAGRSAEREIHRRRPGSKSVVVFEPSQATEHTEGVR